MNTTEIPLKEMYVECIKKICQNGTWKFSGPYVSATGANPETHHMEFQPSTQNHQNRRTSQSNSPGITLGLMILLQYIFDFIII